jgi:AraC-like DNA-binding protein
VIHYGGGGAPTTFVSGSFRMSAFDAPLISTILPRYLHLRLEQNRSHAFQSVLDLLAAETAQPGIASARLISCLYESLFVYAIRAYADNSAAPLKGWLGAMSDMHLSKAIGAMHSRIDMSWSVKSLAREARMSRSAFALKFKTVLGQTPLEYLTRWRMYRAGAMIRSNNMSFLEVASAIGYGSESSFSRVFKREMGAAPREYRRNCALLESSTAERLRASSCALGLGARYWILMTSGVLKKPPFVTSASTLGTSRMYSRNHSHWFSWAPPSHRWVVAKQCGIDSSDP